MSSVNFLEKLLCGVEVEWIPLEQLIHSLKEILQNLAISLIGAAQSWHAHRHEAKQP